MRASVCLHAIMEAMRESWTDERLDDFRAETGRRFDEVDRRFDEVDRRFEGLERRMEAGFHRVDHRIDDLTREVNARFDALNRTLLQVGTGLVGAVIVGFLGLIATQL